MHRSPLRLLAVLALAACLVAVCVPAVHAGALPDLHTMAVQGASLAALPLFAAVTGGGIRPMLGPDDGAGSGGSGNAGGATSLTREEVLAIARDEMKRAAGSGDTPNLDAMAARLADEKEKTASARRELADAKAKIPADGAVILTGDEATTYTTLKAREGAGETPLKAAAEALTKAQADATELATLRGKTALADAVAAETAAGKPLNQLALETYVKDLQTEVADHTENGKTVKRAFAVVKDAAGNVTKTLLSDHLKAEHAALMPALTAAPQQADGKQQGGGTGQQGGGFVTQQAGGTGGGDGFDLDAYIASRNDARSGAKPASATAAA